MDSQYELQTIIAQVEALTTTLEFSRTSTYPSTWGFVGNLSLTSMVRGTKTLTVTARDVFGNSQHAQVDFIYDRKAILTLSAPDDFTVARPFLPVQVFLRGRRSCWLPSNYRDRRLMLLGRGHPGERTIIH